ncbi:MAG TPA: SDR family oxidoreductase, partial [Candidatus Atribacteria bacterium]|nr:SDR family oxidoreductase [Candidatus Atribacteria bacterium]HQE25378.1 SDR family oxidoreductase [Candidatus Atribacteria bacterium]
AQSHYNSSKAGVIMLTKSLASEWAPYNVRVNTIAPGYMETQLVGDLLQEYPEYADLWKKLTPLGRLGSPEEIKGPCVFLASPASSYVTGSVLVMDGGYTVW